jgi:hypothetical protein
MNLDDAIRRAGANDQVQRLKDFFLGSIFASLTEFSAVKEWTLLYYNPRTKTVVDCLVNEKFVTVGEETPAINEMQRLQTDDVRVSVDKALSTVRSQFKKTAINILISLHNKEIEKKSYVVWTIGLVTQDIAVTSFDIDAASGAVLKEETTRLIRKLD